jgi:hypothetical protein
MTAVPGFRRVGLRRVGLRRFGLRRVGPRRVGLQPRSRLAVVTWAVAVVSLAGFIAAWVLAARNRDLLHITADSGPDRFLAAYPVVGAVRAEPDRHPGLDTPIARQ